jgi:hypothetical protein
VWPLTPSVATRKHGYLVAPSPGQARGRLQVRTGGSRGGAPYGSRPHWWTGYQIERLCNGSRYVRSARARRGALGLQEPIHHQQLPIRSSRAWLAVRQSASLSTPVGTPSGRESWILDRLALPRPFASGQLPCGPPTCSTSGRSTPTRHRAPTSWRLDCPACGRRARWPLRPRHPARRPRRRGPGLAEALDVLTTELASY